MKKKLCALGLLFVFFGLSLGAAAQVFQFYNNLYYGMRNNPEVARLQDFLKEKGYLNIALSTGNFYSLTFAAVKNYQAANSLPSTGYFGPLTRAVVNRELQADSLAQPREAAPALPPGCTGTSAYSATTGEPCSVMPSPTPAPTAPPAPPASSEYNIDPKPSYDLEDIASGIHDLINQERLKAGLGELAFYPQLAEVALLHSDDQAKDNIEITDPEILCHYPLIRHEGIRGGYSLAERLDSGGIDYRYAGENIVMFSTGINFIYQYSSDNPPPRCPLVEDFEEGEGTRQERLDLYRGVLEESRDAVRGLPEMDWVNKEWRSEDEIEEEAVELWMNSPGHRASILNPYFDYHGIGIVEVNDYLIMTDDFTGF